MDAKRFLPAISVRDDVECSSDGAEDFFVRIEADEARAVALRSFDLHNVRSDLLNDVVPIHRNSLVRCPKRASILDNIRHSPSSSDAVRSRLSQVGDVSLLRHLVVNKLLTRRAISRVRLFAFLVNFAEHPPREVRQDRREPGVDTDR